MIQRIQTIFLLFAVVFQLAMIFFPIVIYALPNKEILILTASGFKTNALLSEKLFSTAINLVFICAIAIVIFVNIFLFKNRTLQMRICFLSTLLLIGFQLYIYWFAWDSGQKLEAITNYKLIIIFPVISAILTILAYISIKKDDKLVRSLDRIR